MTPPDPTTEPRKESPEYHMFRPKRAWVPEWLWRIVKHVAVWEPFTTLFTEPPDEADWGR